MTRNTSETCQTALNGSLPDAGGAAGPDDKDAVRRACALDLSTRQWLRVFRSLNGPSLSRREIFAVILEQRFEWLSRCSHGNDPCPESLQLSKRTGTLPRMPKLTDLEMIERFWTSEAAASSPDGVGFRTV
ncbi:hypothetical protein [Profundibacterium mesophilum]|uniref:Uncharacterized protein n=1 Tax=Profundibacterium mesophilum KAUST100406-0324 TaxID=1037889 RepID=A0A921TED9_9RHOB|nr:hypothetical protein [Profundibacterium mesophilum]KAF0677217.1 hypothetical protein PMES_00534 [Profundibacterium mesophilum KAUST100406-0324]